MLTFKISVQQETSLRRHHSFIKKMNIHTIDFPGGSEVKASASSAGDPGLIPGSGRSLEKEMVTHSSILAWRVPWTESLVGYSPWGH